MQPVITLEQLRKIAPKAPGTDLDQLNEAMVRFKISTPKRAAAFVAQLCVECMEFTTFEEIWGPTADQTRYERPLIAGLLAPLEVGPRLPLWQRLGNMERGDGSRFRGRAGIQVTGHGNYQRCGNFFAVDFVKNPELLSQPEWRYLASGWYWIEHSLSVLADDGDMVEITRRINGPGMYGLRQRQAYYDLALPVLGATATCSPGAGD